jgi:HD-GYP domain-containing protein (c-di-GMP phosphodiesterase class II)
MHDIGKIGVPDHILQKEGPLTDEEFEIIKRHTVEGYDVLNCSHQPLFEVARTIAYSHHENWDGTGYPQGLKGEEIPREARITRIVDVFDALLTERPYKKPWPLEVVMEYMRKGKGDLFDPELLDLFMDNINEVIEIFWSLEDSESYESPVRSRGMPSVSPADKLL